ncbi:MAG: VanZ family protein [Chthoniobacterales bacterium]
MKIRQIARAWLPVVLWMALMFFGSTDLMSAEHTSRFLTPFLRWLNPEISWAAIAQAHFFVRKAAHVTEYAILAALLFRGWRSLFSVRAAVVAAFVTAVAFAAGDEFHQTFVASRTGAIGDVVIDCSGALLSLFFCWILSVRQRPSRNDEGIERA